MRNWLLGGVPQLASFANMIKVEAAAALAPDPMRRLGALGLFIVEDAERLRDRLRLANAEHERLLAMAERWWQVSPAHGAADRARTLLYRLGPVRFLRSRAAGMVALAGGRRRSVMACARDLAGAMDGAALSAAGGRPDVARYCEGPGARRGTAGRRGGLGRGGISVRSGNAGRDRRPGGRPAVIQSAIQSALAGVSIPQLALIVAVGMLTSVLGGVTGYGTGALMPLVLVPIVGAEPVVPIIAISAIITNVSRALAFRRAVDWRRVALVVVTAIPTCILGAWAYTLLTGRGAMLVIGSMLIAMVALRRLAAHRGFRCGDGGLVAGALGWGIVVGGTTGSGVILLSLLMAAGLQGAAVIATDATVSIAIGLVRLAVFGIAGVATAQVIAVAVLIGVATFPGAFFARWMVARLPIHVHAAMLDVVVVLGGTIMIANAEIRSQ